MNKLIRIIIKNFRLIIRSKISGLITIFGPLFITLLVGLAFNNASNYSINIGVYSPEYNDFVNSFITKLEDAQFRVLKTESKELCIDNIQQGVVNICMTFPKSFEIASNDNKDVSNEIKFYVDPSRMNLVDSVIDMISTKVASRTQEISAELTTEILTTLDNSKSTIEKQDPRFVSLIDMNDQMQSKQGQLKSALGEMNFEFNADTYKVGDIKQVETTLSSSILAENSSINEKINESMLLIEEILSYFNEDPALNGSATETDLEELEEAIVDIDEQLEELNTETVDALETAVDNLETQIQATKEKFDLAIDKRVEVSGGISYNEQNLETSLNTMMLIMKELQDAKKEINQIKVTDSETIVQPVKITKEEVVSKTYLNYMFPSIVALVIMLVAILFSSTIVMMEKRSKAYFRNLVVPNPDILYLVANLLSTLILVVLQLILILSVSYFVFDVNVLTNILPTSVILLLITVLFSIIGILIGVAFNSAETGTLAAISITSISLFLSDVILPLESMPLYFIDIARFNPFVISQFLLRRSILFNASLQTIASDSYFISQVSALFLILIYISLFALIIIILNTFIKKHIIRKYVLRIAPKNIGKVVDDTAGKKLDPVKKIDVLLDEAREMINIRDYKRAHVLYLSINELYTLLPKKKKEEVFDKIVNLQEKIKRKT
ncbi:MAG: hypothetical protein MAG795_00759 [Candidatus Woesearchaeota archaeon]|nr:hypothetical protein [Candidatus Woesearchaeota archaeon]